MTAEEIMVSVLSSSAALVALVAERIYPIAIPQAVELPAVVFTRIATQPGRTLDGDLGSGWARIQIEILDTSWASARLVRSAIRAALEEAASAVGSADTFDPDRQQYRLVDDYSIYEEVA